VMAADVPSIVGRIGGCLSKPRKVFKTEKRKA
jgi:hypothetical protein